METASLDDFVALNEQLAALVDAGIPLEVGLNQPDLPAAKELERINATVVRRVNRGETLTEALQGDEQDLPAGYRSMVQLGLQTGYLPAALNGSRRVAESADNSRFALQTAVFYPLIVCSVAYLGLVGFCMLLVPTLEELYESFGIEPGPGLRVMLMLRNTLPYWIAIPPIVLVAFIVWRQRSKRRQAKAGVYSSELFGWLPGVSQIGFQERCARFAESLAALLDGDVPFADALPIAGESSGDSGLTEGAKSLAAEVSDGRLPGDDSPLALRFPPFLRWAVWHSDATTGRVRALQIAARTYRDAAQRRAERLEIFAPMIVLVLVGGTVTLLYGLALFVPVIELLTTLAS